MITSRDQGHSLHPSKGEETRERILATAERLFAERGIEGVSVRTILNEAGANIALAHRYFGGRDGLIEEVLRRAVGPLNERRLLLLEEVEARGSRSTIEDVLRALFAPSIRWLYEQPERARLLAQLQTATDPKLRVLHRQYFDAPLQKFAEVMVRTIQPRIGPLEFVCRFTFANGALHAVYRHGLEVAKSAHRLLGPDAVPNERDWVEQIVSFCAAGLTSTVTAGVIPVSEEAQSAAPSRAAAKTSAQSPKRRSHSELPQPLSSKAVNRSVKQPRKRR